MSYRSPALGFLVLLGVGPFLTSARAEPPSPPILSVDAFVTQYCPKAEEVPPPTAYPGVITQPWAMEAGCHFPLNVHLRGRILGGLTFCTAMACPDESNPCCNSCGGEPLLAGERFQLILDIPGFDCSGTNCGVTCEGVELGQMYELQGHLLRRNEVRRGELYVAVTSYQAAPAP